MAEITTNYTHTHRDKTQTTVRMSVSLEEFVATHTGSDSYTTLHAAIIDLLVSVRTITSTALLEYIKKAILTLKLDQVETEEESEALNSMMESGDVPGIDASTLSRILTSTNTRLEKIDMEIVESKDMDDSSIILFSFVNKKPTGAIHLATKYSQNDIQLVKRVIDRIFSPAYVINYQTTDEDTGKVSQQITYSVPFMKMVKSLRDGPAEDDDEDGTVVVNTLTLDESEDFLRDLECYGWLERHNENYSLATRGIVELRKYLIDTYGVFPEGTVSTCFGCGDILTRGLVCPEGKCHVRFHEHCRGLVERSRSDKKCPGGECGEDLDDFVSF